MTASSAAVSVPTAPRFDIRPGAGGSPSLDREVSAKPPIPDVSPAPGHLLPADPTGKEAR
ncbi:hypothetical protein GCM10011594_09940 [Nakamurella endophytica]|uniref:Uncharacterized protein n=1 Tax=Nakamurella endophytica TaxID=1748367 RepID=A0A917WD90_9ACTN|nr:hypothetical protein GCM10011594_09940 [Nakamurella endophytica]